jgi:hypothetical protein
MCGRNGVPIGIRGGGLVPVLYCTVQYSLGQAPQLESVQVAGDTSMTQINSSSSALFSGYRLHVFDARAAAKICNLCQQPCHGRGHGQRPIAHHDADGALTCRAVHVLMERVMKVAVENGNTLTSQV